MFAPESLKEKLWRELDEDIKFTDPAIALERYLGVYFDVSVKEDGTVVLKTQMTNYLRDAVKAPHEGAWRHYVSVCSYSVP